MQLLPPKHPWAIPLSFHAVEGDLVFKRVHRLPESIMAVRTERTSLDEARKRLLDQLLAVLEVVEDLAAQGEISPVDPYSTGVHRAHRSDVAVFIEAYGMETL